MTLSTKTPPALAIKLQRGGKRGRDLEILDANSGKPVALILESAQAEVLAQLVLAAPDLLWGIVRSAAHLDCEAPEGATPEKRKICKLLRDAFDHATKFPAKK